VLTHEDLDEIEGRITNLHLEFLPQIVTVDVPALISEVRLLKVLLFSSVESGEEITQGGDDDDRDHDEAFGQPVQDGGDALRGGEDGEAGGVLHGADIPPGAGASASGGPDPTGGAEPEEARPHAFGDRGAGSRDQVSLECL